MATAAYPLLSRYRLPVLGGEAPLLAEWKYRWGTFSQLPAYEGPQLVYSSSPLFILLFSCAALPFKPIYNISMNHFKMVSKQFDYTNKKFSTVVKKSDPVSRYQALNQGWKKSKFLKNSGNAENQTGNAQGSQLQLSERIAASKPEYIFHKYLNKDQTKMIF